MYGDNDDVYGDNGDVYGDDDKVYGDNDDVPVYGDDSPPSQGYILLLFFIHLSLLLSNSNVLLLVAINTLKFNFDVVKYMLV